MWCCNFFPSLTNTPTNEWRKKVFITQSLSSSFAFVGFGSAVWGRSHAVVSDDLVVAKFSSHCNSFAMILQDERCCSEPQHGGKKGWNCYKFRRLGSKLSWHKYKNESENVSLNDFWHFTAERWEWYVIFFLSSRRMSIVRSATRCDGG